MTYANVGWETGPVFRSARRHTHQDRCESPPDFRRRAHLRWTTPCDDGFFSALVCVPGGLRCSLPCPRRPSSGTELNISDARGGVADLLTGGQQLEEQRRWGEALAHYEEAIRQYPNDTVLQQRFNTARLHYDLGRRYADRSFCESVLGMSADGRWNSTARCC